MVFTRFMAIYGHKFKSSFETESEMRIAKREWAMSLAEYSENELVAAVTVSKETLAWAPSISEFIVILDNLNGAMGMVDVRPAYREACFHAQQPSKHKWSHPTIYHAGQATGWFELRSQQEKTSFPVFEYHYQIMCRRFRKGDPLDKPSVPAIVNKQDATLSQFIINWADEQQLAPELASSLLYFMTKPKGSKTRENFRIKSLAKIQALDLSVQLPD